MECDIERANLDRDALNPLNNLRQTIGEMGATSRYTEDGDICRIRISLKNLMGDPSKCAGDIRGGESSAHVLLLSCLSGQVVKGTLANLTTGAGNPVD
jgi:hypothetical protein